MPTALLECPVSGASSKSFWAHFSIVFGIFVGFLLASHYDDFISNWKFIPRQSLLHSPVYPLVAIGIYLVVINILPRIMRNREPLQMNLLVTVHNWVLSVGSAVVLFKILQQVFLVFGQEDGLRKVCCNAAEDLHPIYHNISLSPTFWSAFVSPVPRDNIPSSPLVFWYHVFFLSKFYELLDTVFLILRKKPVIFLHWYHHVVTLLLVWVCMDHSLSFTWFPTVANTFVHVFMYFYYMCQILKVNIWWKRYLTQLQIVQFVMDLSGNMSWAYYRVFKGLECSGSWFAFSFATFILGSFLVLFLQFYKTTYGKLGHRVKKVDGTTLEEKKTL